MDDVMEKLKQGIQLDSRQGGATALQGSTFLGGMPNQILVNLTGCISNVFMHR